MKKILLFASAIALMTSCAEMDLGTEGSETSKLPAGISFSATINEGVDTRAEWEYVPEGLGMLWHAEADKMDFYVKNAKIGEKGTSNSDWAIANKAVYKATRSTNKGYFTADNNTTIITPVKDKTGKWLAPEFAYVWPTETSVALVETNLIATLPNITAQAQNEVNGSSTLGFAFMTGTTKVDASTIKDYTSGSDMLVNIKLERKMPLLGFYLKGYDANTYGKLTTIKIASLGEITADGKVDDKTKSNLNYGTDAKWNINEADLSKAYTAGIKETASEVTLTMNNTTGLAWGNGKDYTAFMTVAPVDRSKMKLGEKMQITYTFENTTVVRDITVTNNWVVGHHFYAKDLSGADGFDLSAEPYVVFGKTSTLQLNPSFKGSIESIVDKEGNIIHSTTKIAAITTLVANVALSDADFTYLGKTCPLLAKITLNKNTSIPAFDVAGTNQYLTDLSAPLVTKIDEKAFNCTKGGGLQLATCLLPSYPFDNANVTKALLKANYLTSADLSAVSVIAPAFPAIGMTLQGFAKLTTVTLKPGVQLGAKAFFGCSTLKTVKFNAVGASVNLIGAYAFGDCTVLNNISVSNTDIPQGSFSGCTALTTINDAGGKAIVPTKIGENAFAGTAIVDIDLSSATEIGQSAFKGCKQLVGKADKKSGVNVLRVSAIKTLNASVFENCTSIKYISFPIVETVFDSFLKGVVCNEIEFLKVFKYGGTGTMVDASFGTATDIKTTTTLFVNGGQAVSGSEITLGGTKFTFKSIK